MTMKQEWNAGSKLYEYVEIKDDFYKDMIKLQDIDMFIKILKEWVFPKLWISLDPVQCVGRLYFDYGRKDHFVISLPYEPALLLKKYLDPEEKKDEKDIQEEIQNK